MIEFTALKSLHVHLSEYGGGRWCFFPLMAICTWLLLRLFPDKRLALEILRSAAGWLAVGAAPLWWLGRFGTDWDHFSMLFGQVGFYELIVTFWCIALYLTHRWPVPSWAGLLLLSGHYTYWLWQFHGYLRGYWYGFESLLHYALEERSLMIKTLKIFKTVLEAGWSDLVAVTALMPIVGLLSGLAWVLYRSNERVA